MERLFWRLPWDIESKHLPRTYRQTKFGKCIPYELYLAPNVTDDLEDGTIVIPADVLIKSCQSRFLITVFRSHHMKPEQLQMPMSDLIKPGRSCSERLV